MRSKKDTGFALGLLFCTKEFHFVTKKNLLLIMGETFQRQKNAAWKA